MDHLELQALASELEISAPSGMLFLVKHSVLLLDNYKH